MFSRSTWLAKSVRYSVATSAVVCIGSGVLLSRRIALEDEKGPSDSQEYYRSRPTSALLSSLFVYTFSASPGLVSIGKASIQVCDVLRMPILYEAIAKRTFFAQFCGGETCSEVQETMKSLRRDRMGTILNYAKEEDGSDEQSFERVKSDTLASIDVAASLPNNYIAVKLTALANPTAMKAHTSLLRCSKEDGACAKLQAEDQLQIDNLSRRFTEIMDHAVRRKVKVLIDAEQDRYQGTIEAVTLAAFRKYNTREAVAYGTYQCYLKHTVARLEEELVIARKEGWKMGAKLVRGAYIASDPRHLIHDTKEETDCAYNAAIKIALKTKDVETIIATHNPESLDVALGLFPPAGPVAFSQLYGMGAPVTYSLLRKLEAMPQTDSMRQGGSLRVYSYLPWGTVGESMKYLLRRADENSSMADRVKEERNDIASELYKRMCAHLYLA